MREVRKQNLLVINKLMASRSLNPLEIIYPQWSSSANWVVDVGSQIPQTSLHRRPYAVLRISLKALLPPARRMDLNSRLG